MTHIFPGTVAPLVCNAPMAGATNAALAGAVTKAGGLGMHSLTFPASAISMV